MNPNHCIKNCPKPSFSLIDELLFTICVRRPNTDKSSAHNKLYFEQCLVIQLKVAVIQVVRKVGTQEHHKVDIQEVRKVGTQVAHKAGIQVLPKAGTQVAHKVDIQEAHKVGTQLDHDHKAGTQVANKAEIQVLRKAGTQVAHKVGTQGVRKVFHNKADMGHHLTLILKFNNGSMQLILIVLDKYVQKNYKEHL